MSFPHPFDPLSPEEIAAVSATPHENAKADETGQR